MQNLKTITGIDLATVTVMRIQTTQSQSCSKNRKKHKLESNQP